MLYTYKYNIYIIYIIYICFIINIYIYTSNKKPFIFICVYKKRVIKIK